MNSIESYVLQMKIQAKNYTYRNFKVDECLCKVCDLQTVENQLHFVIDCPAYSQLRLVNSNWIIKPYCTQRMGKAKRPKVRELY